MMFPFPLSPHDAPRIRPRFARVPGKWYNSDRTNPTRAWGFLLALFYALQKRKQVRRIFVPGTLIVTMGEMTRQMNETLRNMQENCETCPVPADMRKDLCRICATQQMLRGKWKLMIIWLLRDHAMRFSQLMAAIPNVKQGPLTHQLKELTAKGLIRRTMFDEMPPRVEYSLTEKGISFLQVLHAMDDWAQAHLFP
jgi:DNA-binding HxlR family transcriptional regulator